MVLEDVRMAMEDNGAGGFEDSYGRQWCWRI